MIKNQLYSSKVFINTNNIITDESMDANSNLIITEYYEKPCKILSL